MMALLKKININKADLILFLWLLYSYHWFEISPGSFLDSISSPILGINFLIALKYIARMRKMKGLPIYFKGSNTLLIIFCIYGIIPIIFGGSVYHEHGDLSPASYMVGVLRSFLPVYAFFYLSRLGLITENKVKCWLFVFFVAYLYFFVTFSIHKMENTMKDGITNNLGYLFVSLIPFVYLFRGKLFIQYVIATVLLTFSILSMKRGAILIAAILYFIFVLKQFGLASKRMKIVVVIVFVCILIIGTTYLMDFYETNVLFQQRIESTLEGNTSNRDVISEKLLAYYVNDANFFQQLFGSGADATLWIYGLFAHNDWLEILCDQGLLGLTIYVIYWIRFKKQCDVFSHKSENYLILISVLVSTLLRGFFSMSYSVLPVSTSLLIGYCIAQTANYKHNILRNGIYKQIDENFTR